MSRSVLSREEYLDRWSTLHGGYDPRTSRIVGPWLTVVHAVATPFARLGVPPDVVTLLGGEGFPIRFGWLTTTGA